MDQHRIFYAVLVIKLHIKDKTLIKRFFVIFILLFFSAFTLIAKPAVDEEPITVEMMFHELPDDTPILSFLPINKTIAVSQDIVDFFQKLIVEKAITSGCYKPYSIDQWLGSSYTDSTANSINSLLDRLVAERYPVSYIMAGTVSVVGEFIGLNMSFYETGKSRRIHHYFRLIPIETIYEELPRYTEDLIQTMNDRFSGTELYTIDKTYYINPVIVDFYHHSHLFITDQHNFSPVPYLKLNEQEYVGTDDFFSSLVCNQFYATKIAHAESCVYAPQITPDRFMENNSDYIIDLKLKVSEIMAVVTVTIKENKTKRVIVQYQEPILEWTWKGLMDASRGIVKIALYGTVDEFERSLLGDVYVSEGIDSNEFIYKNGNLIGLTPLTNLVLPVGLHELEIGAGTGVRKNSDFGVFVQPFKGSMNLLSFQDYIHLKYLLIK